MSTLVLLKIWISVLKKKKKLEAYAASFLFDLIQRRGITVSQLGHFTCLARSLALASSPQAVQVSLALGAAAYITKKPVKNKPMPGNVKMIVGSIMAPTITISRPIRPPAVLTTSFILSLGNSNSTTSIFFMIPTPFYPIIYWRVDA